MKLASIEKILKLTPIEGADRIEAAQILGYQVVVTKGKHKEGELVVYHFPDTICPERPEYEFLRKHNYRLKVAKFKRQISQGLVLSIEEMLKGANERDQTVYYLDNFLEEGLDVTETVGIKKYEKPISPQLAGKIKGSFPFFLKRTDEESLRSNPEVINEYKDKPSRICLKADGSSGSAYLKDGNFGVCSRNLDLLEDENNTFWKVVNKYKIKEALFNKGGNYCLQFECVGPGIQDNPLKLKEASLLAFNLFDINNNKYLDQDVLVEFCLTNNIPIVKLIWSGLFNFTLEDLIRMANESEYSPGCPAEGIVIRCCPEVYSEVLRGRLSSKVISERYCLKNNQ